MLTREPSDEARVDHRRAFVDAPADGRKDALGDAPDVLFVAEQRGRFR